MLKVRGFNGDLYHRGRCSRCGFDLRDFLTSLIGTKNKFSRIQCPKCNAETTISSGLLVETAPFPEDIVKQYFSYVSIAECRGQDCHIYFKPS